jgi:DNA-binding transcriptional MerR regulator
MSIGQVLGVLAPEFPAVSISKLRYLEEQGLLSPARTASGYRKYSAAEVERLRYILAAQRDHFWPLKVIRGKLDELDRGGQAGESRGPDGAGGADWTGPGEVPGPRRGGGAVGLADLATLTGAAPGFVEAVAAQIGVEAGADQAQSTALIQAVEAAQELGEHGLDLRHLRTVFQAAERHADLLESAAAAQRGAGSAGLERAAAHAGEMAESVAGLYQALLRLSLANRGL